ncbi:hypothetical protein [Sulfurimonas sp.]|uniref:hypothetical protein n=1 Tax=Sulfurimonas sp. TaxID=2022749 RepID=UPI0025DCE323|nr:hypothetical protein [Sulfurimonas sp.]MCK9453738.1 hypothetical protein [Sulfurimonas sp.]
MIKKILFAAVFILAVSGCVDKKKVLNIQNQDLCSAPVATLYLNTLEIQNKAETFNITEDELLVALTENLQKTNCFMVSTQERDKESLNVDYEYLLDTKVTLFQEREVYKKNIFKKEEREILSMDISLYAHNNGKKINANAKSELAVSKSKILGFSPEKDIQNDKKTVLQNATKRVSILLNDGFIKMQKSQNY